MYYRYSNRDRDSVLSIKKKPVISDTSIKFPIILNCLQCSSRVRVARPGSFRCPSCKSVSEVDVNGEMEITEKSEEIEEKIEEKSIAAVPSNQKFKSLNTNRRSRMEQFLSGDENEDEIKEGKSKSKLSASEKLRLLEKESNEESELVEKDEETDEEVVEEEKPKRSQKRKPPKGGSFGPTVGGF